MCVCVEVSQGSHRAAHTQPLIRSCLTFSTYQNGSSVKDHVRVYEEQKGLASCCFRSQHIWENELGCVDEGSSVSAESVMQEQDVACAHCSYQHTSHPLAR